MIYIDIDEDELDNIDDMGEGNNIYSSMVT